MLRGVRTLVVLLVSFVTTSISSQEVAVFDYKSYNCLVDNIYYEARGESHLGMMAIAQVTLNRAKKANTTICKVVYAKGQFSWTKMSPHRLTKKREKLAHLQARLVAGAAVAAWPGAGHGKMSFSHLPLKIKRAHFFHHVDIEPEWASKMEKLGTIGNHVFYKG
jgi:spore germination cell wall hydrolase CwlJ-like protein